MASENLAAATRRRGRADHTQADHGHIVCRHTEELQPAGAQVPCRAGLSSYTKIPVTRAGTRPLCYTDGALSACPTFTLAGDPATLGVGQWTGELCPPGTGRR